MSVHEYLLLAFCFGAMIRRKDATKEERHTHTHAHTYILRDAGQKKTKKYNRTHKRTGGNRDLYARPSETHTHALPHSLMLAKKKKDNMQMYDTRIHTQTLNHAGSKKDCKKKEWG